MEEHSIYEQIAARTGGSVYLGVVGPVRTGKSTFVKRLMEQLVLPNIADPYQRERAQDELPQAASGKTIMTAEPKFVPEQAVEIRPDGKTALSVRLIDTVGYLIPGAVGAEEDGAPRMVTTPWYPEEIPMTEAAELGTKKVMDDHSTIGILITTDGTITDIPRADYVDAERRAIADMQKAGKPFLVLVNSAQPKSEAAQSICREIGVQTGAACMAVNCLTMEDAEICEVLTELLYEFPVQELQVYFPAWLAALPEEHALKGTLYAALRDRAAQITTLRQAEPALRTLCTLEEVEDVRILGAELGSGAVRCELTCPEGLFFALLSEQAGVDVPDNAALMQTLTELAAAKREYDKVAAALAEVRATGYGVVMPEAGEVHLEKPEIVRKNGAYAVRLRASAPSIHMLRADVETEISPMVGGEQESEQLIRYLLSEYEEQTEKLWESNLFGKSLYELVSEGLSSKLTRMPDDVRAKLRRTLCRMINENTGGMICILL